MDWKNKRDRDGGPSGNRNRPPSTPTSSSALPAPPVTEEDIALLGFRIARFKGEPKPLDAETLLSDLPLKPVRFSLGDNLSSTSTNQGQGPLVGGLHPALFLSPTYEIFNTKASREGLLRRDAAIVLAGLTQGTVLQTAVVVVRGDAETRQVCAANIDPTSEWLWCVPRDVYNEKCSRVAVRLTWPTRDASEATTILSMLKRAVISRVCSRPSTRPSSLSSSSSSSTLSSFSQQQDLAIPVFVNLDGFSLKKGKGNGADAELHLGFLSRSEVWSWESNVDREFPMPNARDRNWWEREDPDPRRREGTVRVVGARIVALQREAPAAKPAPQQQHANNDSRQFDSRQQRDSWLRADSREPARNNSKSRWQVTDTRPRDGERNEGRREWQGRTDMSRDGLPQASNSAPSSLPSRPLATRPEQQPPNESRSAPLFYPNISRTFNNNNNNNNINSKPDSNRQTFVKPPRPEPQIAPYWKTEAAPPEPALSKKRPEPEPTSDLDEVIEKEPQPVVQKKKKKKKDKEKRSLPDDPTDAKPDPDAEPKKKPKKRRLQLPPEPEAEPSKPKDQPLFRDPPLFSVENGIMYFDEPPSSPRSPSPEPQEKPKQKSSASLLLVAQKRRELVPRVVVKDGRLVLADKEEVGAGEEVGREEGGKKERGKGKGTVVDLAEDDGVGRDGERDEPEVVVQDKKKVGDGVAPLLAASSSSSSSAPNLGPFERHESPVSSASAPASFSVRSSLPTPPHAINERDLPFDEPNRSRSKTPAPTNAHLQEIAALQARLEAERAQLDSERTQFYESRDGERKRLSEERRELDGRMAGFLSSREELEQRENLLDALLRAGAEAGSAVISAVAAAEQKVALAKERAELDRHVLELQRKQAGNLKGIRAREQALLVKEQEFEKEKAKWAKKLARDAERLQRRVSEVIVVKDEPE